MAKGPAKPQGRQIGHVLFGDTDIADGIPEAYRPSPSAGPVFFEGWLILALSFQPDQETGQLSNGEVTQPSKIRSQRSLSLGEIGLQSECQLPLEDDEPRFILQLWDCLSGSWFEDSPVVWRYDAQDVVFVDGQPVWIGTLDTRVDVNLVPGWSSECARINNQVYLRWKARNHKEDEC